MENIDLETINHLLTEGGEQWRMLAEEVATRARTMIIIGLFLMGFGGLSAYRGHMTRNSYHEGMPWWFTCLFSSIIGLVMFISFLEQALAPMMTVIEGLLK